jgi:NMD protein affecting ribosome stability and mRNA decay
VAGFICGVSRDGARETRSTNKEQNELKDMKTANENTRMVRGSGLALVTILIAAFTAVAPASAQYKPTGDDGITASPKVRAMLDERKARTTTVSAAVPAMACPKCKDTWVAQADTDSKGLGARTLMGKTTKLVARHLCDGCGVDWAIAGTGKAKHAIATHKCSSCGSENLGCCSTKGSSDVATKGMGQRFEVAPVK